MRLVWSSYVFPAAFIGLAVVGSFGTQFLRAAEQADLFKVNSVWQGTCEQSNPKSSYPMILFVKQRKGDTFEGVTWYPTLGNGLVKVTGRTDPKGVVTFTEGPVIHAELHQGLIVVAGGNYQAKLESTTLKGTGEWVNPKTRQRFTLKFALELAVTLQDNLTVARGQLTFDAEGREGEPFHSRKLHWPGGASGVTIGRGYDMKLRTPEEVTATLTAAGVEAGLAKQYAEGAKLEGPAAEDFVRKSKLPEITPEQQKRLFELTYAEIETDVKRIVSSPKVVAEYGATDWDKLKPAIKDLLIDLRFRGDYTNASRKRLQPLVVKNDLEGILELLSDREAWPDVPPDRYMRRVNYLRAAAGKPPLKVRIGFDDDAPNRS